MTLRRALWASPLAVSVAVLAHLCAFGFVHAPGAANAPGLLWTLAGSLILGLSGAFARGALERPPGSIATSRPSAYAPLLLAGAGTLAFGLIELSEGHLAFSALFQAALAALPLAYLVTFTARSAHRAARSAGLRYARFARREHRLVATPGTIARLDRGRRFVLTPVAHRGPSRGRAPPVFV